MRTIDLNRTARLQKTMTIQWRGNSVIGRSTIQRMTDIRLLMVDSWAKKNDSRFRKLSIFAMVKTEATCKRAQKKVIGQDHSHKC